MNAKEHTVSTTLDPEQYKRFLKLKEKLGLKWNANVLRAIIADAYRKIVERGEFL